MDKEFEGLVRGGGGQCGGLDASRVVFDGGDDAAVVVAVALVGYVAVVWGGVFCVDEARVERLVWEMGGRSDRRGGVLIALSKFAFRAVAVIICPFGDGDEGLGWEENL